ncbi:MAG: biosynthetic-type acetolactate synthase large subunit [Candidatus Jettenia sp.]|uniref:Acetolactate synthase n=1 Tax=Candidatus Jettenia caeni TaxID=247490 RepID=I3IRJ7_9BACT|nr:biosynthetic-type acetolactate synthase large subunit [Candidatus Jettenia sp. AMX1]MBC6928396.1 biosynthetic-type acetolactate synthase large subunit [Candidatus Jettenia sp.]NUN22158.1 biosynthetic-type acetolactate synthase large subunit [Candidatus Jettenia caeni]KAA0250486.1 MAG: biosynthetic-type acetolactate synthase large subunit [Candidatus Jettenia sp. AMX1]MCE7879675.1 biosynthetic-type acetolactate synthase large subunit [Candidatus Jettenia sp. AMX1]MCQ3926543.1 biosynthetic-ty
MIKTGSQILVDALIREGVEYVFGIPGGAVLPLFDVLFESPIKFILTRHEQGAGHAADGYARATGKVGVCLATSGPGATNLATAIATAYMDSIPVVAITGQVKTFLIGNDAFQEADIIGITRPITKHSYLVKDIKDLARIVKEAFYIANTGRRGPVLIDLPVDITMEKCEEIIPAEVNLPGYKPKYEGNIRQIKIAAEVINNSKRPVVYTGGGIIASDCSKELLEFSEKGNLPVTTTLMGLGGFPEDHHLSLGMLGMHGTAYANFAVTESDVLIAIGARFDDRITGKIDEFAPDAKIIHIDIDPSSISKSIEVDIPVVGDAKNILKELKKYIHFVERREWFDKIRHWKEKSPLSYNNNGNVIKPQYVIEQICDVARGNAIITTEVGQNQMWAAQFFTFTKPRTFLSSGGLGTMGYGFPAAIGAQLGCPDKIVVDIAGDGSIQMNIQELSTVVRLNIPVKIAILNNGYLGMVRQWQELFYNKRYSGVNLDGNPDFVKLAEAYGAKGFLVEKKEDVRPTIEKAFSLYGPVIMDFRVDPSENVFPMVPAGQAIHRMIGTMA